MSVYDTGLENLIPLLWVVSLYLLLHLALRRIKPSIYMHEWKYQTQLRNIRQRPNMMTLLKIYGTIRKSPPKKLAENIRDEFTGNASLAFDKPPAFFIKHRTDSKVMKTYFRDDELVAFFRDPKGWAEYNGATKKRFFGLVTAEDEFTKEFYGNIFRMVDIFEKELAGIKKEQL